MYFKYTILVLFLIVAVAPESFGADVNDYARLRSDLKTGYDPNARPVQHHTNATIVEFGMLLRGIEFDERKNMFTVYCFSEWFWNDFYMKWDPTLYGNLTEIQFAANELWQPDLSVYNNYDSDLDHFHNTRVVAYHIGQLLWLPPTTFRVGCSANLRKWPYDTQTCHVVIGSWTHTGNQLDIRLPANYSTIDSYQFVENREWKILWNTIQKREIYYPCCPTTPYFEVVVTIQIQRLSATHTAAVVVPGLAIAVAILMSFWLRPGATERLALILFVILANSMYLYNVYQMIPNNGDEVPLVILYFRDSLLMVSVALIWTIGLRYLEETKRTSPVPLPSFVQIFLNSLFSKILYLDPRPNSGSSSHSEDESSVNEDGKLVSNNNKYQEDWAWLAHLLDRIAFAIYLIIYIIFTIALL